MSFAAEQEYEHVGETCGIADHDHDLVAELNRRLDSIWRYDQYIANAEWRTALSDLWHEMKAQDLQAVSRLRGLISQEVRNNCF